MKVPSAGRIIVKLNAPSNMRRASISVVEPHAVPVVVATPDAILAAQLNHRAGFLLSCIDGATDVEALIDVCGMPKDEAIAALEGLIDARIISLTPVRKGRPVNATRRTLRPPQGAEAVATREDRHPLARLPKD